MSAAIYESVDGIKAYLMAYISKFDGKKVRARMG